MQRIIQEDGTSEIQGKIIAALLSLITILSVGTIGYWLIGDGEYLVLDCFYMTIITISTIGFMEVIVISDNPQGRVFTIIVALSGIGMLTYLLSNFTALVVEGELNEAFRRKKMEKLIKKYRDHFIVCGAAGIGHYITGELRATDRSCVVVDSDRSILDATTNAFPDQVFVEGDATDNAVQLKAGIERARGLFAAPGSQKSRGLHFQSEP